MQNKSFSSSNFVVAILLDRTSYTNTKIQIALSHEGRTQKGITESILFYFFFAIFRETTINSSDDNGNGNKTLKKTYYPQSQFFVMPYLAARPLSLSLLTTALCWCICVTPFISFPAFLFSYSLWCARGNVRALVRSCWIFINFPISNSRISGIPSIRSEVIMHCMLSYSHDIMY